MFRLTTPPIATAVTPLVGPTGTQVTISGLNFTQKTMVYFGALACPVLTRTTTQLVIQIPGGATGKSSFIIDDGGDATQTTQRFEVSAPPPAPADDHEHAHEHPHEAAEHHHHPHAHPHRSGAKHHHPF
jgi:hypothetical protein